MLGLPTNFDKDLHMEMKGTAAIYARAGNKKFARRSGPDVSQRVRRVVQWLFVALNGWLGIQFLLWVRYCERGGVGLNVPGPREPKVGSQLQV